MAKRKPEIRVPDWARDELQKAYQRIQNLTAARRLWERVFTEKDRRRCGGTLAVAWTPETALTVGMYCTARGTAGDRAVVEVAHALGFLNDRLRDDLLDALGEQSAERDPEKPHWDKQARELRFRGVVVRILDEFEDLGWPTRIDDPLTGGGKDDRRRRAVETLNGRMLSDTIRFACDGDGTGFLWRAKPRRAAKKTAKRKRR